MSRADLIKKAIREIDRGAVEDVWTIIAALEGLNPLLKMLAIATSRGTSNNDVLNQAYINAENLRRTTDPCAERLREYIDGPLSRFPGGSDGEDDEDVDYDALDEQ